MPVRGVAFRLASELPPEAVSLLKDFRLAVNEAVRAGLQARLTSRNALTKAAYKDFRKEHPDMYSQHLVCSFEVAAGVLRNHRRRVREGRACAVPYVRRMMMKAENQAYDLDRGRGIIDLPIRAGLHVQLELVVSRYHRRYLDDPSLSLGSLTLLPDRAIIAFRKREVTPYTPVSVLSLDTNERSMDGVLADGEGVTPVKADYSDVAEVQARHHDRRRRLQRKKAHDRRTSRRLCRREGRREHDRVEHRMHQVADAVLRFAEEERAAIVLEDLRGMHRRGRDRRLNRRLSMWPRRELHRIIEYKAEWRGVPVIKVDPRYSSRTCPICGTIQGSRMGAVFECSCGWRLDRHINASLNLLRTAASRGLEVAGGLRFGPGASQHDVMMVLYDPGGGARPEPNATSRARVVAA